MKAIVLVRKGEPEKAFEIREVPKPAVSDSSVLIKVEGFGLNFADIVAREGMYKDAPPMPCIIGYEVVGRVEACGTNVSNVKPGDRVTALTRFGGYAEYAITDARAAVKISETVSVIDACSLTTQFCTAYFSAAIAANLQQGEKVVVHTASGGVGSALLQYALHLKCEVIATTGSASKIDYLKKQGASHVINIAGEDFYTAVRKISPTGVDVIFDAVGGKFVKQGVKLLDAGGRIVCYGASQMTGASLVGRIKAALQFGIYHPAVFMMSSKSLIGVNMLRMADHKPEVLQHTFQQVLRLYNEGIFKPQEGKLFSAVQIAEAHRFLQSRKAMGKVAAVWS